MLTLSQLPPSQPLCPIQRGIPQWRHVHHAQTHLQVREGWSLKRQNSLIIGSKPHFGPNYQLALSLQNLHAPYYLYHRPFRHPGPLISALDFLSIVCIIKPPLKLIKGLLTRRPGYRDCGGRMPGIQTHPSTDPSSPPAARVLALRGPASWLRGWHPLWR